MKEEFRTDATGSVFRYSSEHQAYIFCGKLNGRTLKEFIERLKSMDDQKTDEPLRTL
jgi:hypothetical protein